MEEKAKWVKATIGRDQYKTEVTTDTHTIVADEPQELGGTDLGPSPGDFLRMSLATCTAITLRMYANRKGYNVQNIEVKVHTEEEQDITRFFVDIRLDGNIDNDVRERMNQIAKKCPVHKLLTQPIEIETQVLA
jgi:putative redox protein